MPSLSERAHGWSHGEYLEQRCRDVIEMVQQAVNGTVGLLLTVREINAGLHELPELEKRVREADFLFLTGVSSECDGLPLGTERQYWAPDSLQERTCRRNPTSGKSAKKCYRHLRELPII